MFTGALAERSNEAAFAILTTPKIAPKLEEEQAEKGTCRRARSIVNRRK